MLEARSSKTRTAGHGVACGASDRSVFGGIVTYNPEMSRLRENIEAIAPQVDALVVFDNASRDITELRSLIVSWVTQGMRIVLVENGVNAGMAVALNRLAGIAHAAGADFIVFLDQDSVAGRGLVSGLLSEMDAGVGLACPVVHDRNVRREVPDDMTRCEVKRPITSGSMVNLDAWKTVGGYDERLFIDWVDDEFCDDLRMHDYRIVRTHAVSISHELGHQEYAWSGPGRDYVGRRRMRKGYYRQNYPAWRWHDRARSEAITIKKYRGSKVGLEEVFIFMKSTCARALLIERDKSQVIKAIATGFREGLSYR